MKDIKIKGLRPTLRVKKRFLLIKYSSIDVDEKKIVFEINNHLLKILGTHQYGALGVWFVKEQCDIKKQLLVLKVATSGVELVQAVLALPFQTSGRDVRCEVLNVSGTLKGLKNNK
ncbi:MAG: Rpp14/Pop5 family protein [Candidatus Woesearchaeota archaeon]